MTEEMKKDKNAGAPGFAEIVGGGLDVIAGDADEGLDEGISQAFAVEGDQVMWTCGRCAHRNDIKATTCAGCGRSFMESARWIADAELPKKRFRTSLKTIGIISASAIVMRLVGGLISPWVAVAALGGIALRWVVRLFR